MNQDNWVPLKEQLELAAEQAKKAEDLKKKADAEQSRLKELEMLCSEVKVEVIKDIEEKYRLECVNGFIYNFGDFLNIMQNYIEKDKQKGSKEILKGKIEELRLFTKNFRDG